MKAGKSTLEKQMDITVNQAMKVHFEEEILVDILSRLPVRSFLRFKCVSIFWRALISDPYFKMKHLRHAKNDKNSQKLLLLNFAPRMICIPCIVVLYHQFHRSRIYENLIALQALDHGIVQSFAVMMAWFLSLLLIIRRILLLWNPSTGESTLLPDPEFPWKESRCGFGYDSTSGEYKIIKIQNRAGGSKLPNEVLALKSGSWRQIDEPPRGILSAPSFTHYLAFVHEAFHWIGCFRDYSVLPSKYCVVSFSLSNEGYAELPLPEQIYRGNQSVGISVLDGMLCVHSRCFSQSMYMCKVWILKDYGVEESWNALFTIQDPYIYGVKPKYRFANGEVLFLCSQIQPGNVFRTSSGPFELWPHSGTLKCIAFTESLISPRSLSY